MLKRSGNIQEVPLEVVGSSVFGRDPKINNQHTFNMFISDNFLVPYAGTKLGIAASQFGYGTTGRALFSSIKTKRLFSVVSEKVYVINFSYNQQSMEITAPQISYIGSLLSYSGSVSIAENNKPQIIFSDNVSLYLYDPSFTGQQVQFTVDISSSTSILNFTDIYNFTTGYELTLISGGALPTGLEQGISYYVSASSPSAQQIILCLNLQDAYNGVNPVIFSSDGIAPNYIQTRAAFSIVTTDFTPGYVTFHNTYFHCAALENDYYNPPSTNTWRLSLQNDGTQFPDTLSGVGYVGTMETKPDHINAVIRFPSGGDMIFVIGGAVTEPWFDTGAQLFPYQRNNQLNIDYGCVNTTAIAGLDTIVVWLARNEKSGAVIMYSDGGPPEKITTDGIDYVFSHLQNPESCEGFLFRKDGHLIYHINFYDDNQSYFYDFNSQKFFQATDQDGNYYPISQVVFFNNQYFGISKDDGNLYIFDTNISTYDWVDSDGALRTSIIPRKRICNNIRFPSQDYFVIVDAGFTIETGDTNYNQNNTLAPYTPSVDLSISYDGGETFSNQVKYELNGTGYRRNKLIWFGLGATNDAVPCFTFWSIGRVIATNGIVNIRL